MSDRSQAVLCCELMCLKMNEQKFIKIFALNFFIATEFQNLLSTTLLMMMGLLLIMKTTHHLVLVQEQGLSTQLSSLSLSSVILSPQW